MKYVAISYRSDNHGKGAFYDHLTVRTMTGLPSKVVKDQAANNNNLASYVNLRAGQNRYGLPLNENIPETADNFAEDAAFLFIPGYSRDADNSQSAEHSARIAFETKLINKAICRGQPVLAVCAGSWTLWQTYHGQLKDVTDHNYGGGMPRPSTTGPKVCNNKMVHKIKAEDGSMLQRAIGHIAIQVNSVHWQAVDENSPQLSSNIRISAYSEEDAAITIKTRQKKKMRPQKCVEAFETKRGVPMVGVQWHPEAFNLTDVNAGKHQAVFNIVKAAGDIYLNRRAWNNEFKQHWQANAFSEHSFFRPRQENGEKKQEHKLGLKV